MKGTGQRLIHNTIQALILKTRCFVNDATNNSDNNAKHTAIGKQIGKNVEVIMAQFWVLSQNFSRRADENHKNP
jgi:hypothetical protein